jgi:hypothetical protein
MQESRGECHAQAGAELRLPPQKIGGQGRLAVTWRQRMQRAKRKGERNREQAAGAQLGGEPADRRPLQAGKVDHDPIRHVLRPDLA